MTSSTTVFDGDTAIELPFTFERVLYRGGAGFAFDIRLQRTYMPKKSADIAKDFDANALSVITLSERADGTRLCLDGQHRVRAGDLVNHDGYTAKVYKNLTEEQEAKLFRQLNNTSKVNTLELFRVALTEKRAPELQVQRIVEEAGLVTVAGHANSFTAVKTALRVLERRDGDEHLRWALKVATAAWGRTQDACQGPLIEGLAMFRARHGSLLDTESFVKKLSGRAGKGTGLLGDARTLQRSYGGSVKSNVCEVLTTAYNLGLRKYKLPDWRTSEAAAKQEEAEAERAAAVEEVRPAPVPVPKFSGRA